MIHTRDREEAVDVVDVHMSVCAEELVDGLVVVQRVPGADQLVSPPYVLQELPASSRAHEGSQVWVDCLEVRVNEYTMLCSQRDEHCSARD